jgi:hypothetical protein
MKALNQSRIQPCRRFVLRVRAARSQQLQALQGIQLSCDQARAPLGRAQLGCLACSRSSGRRDLAEAFAPQLQQFGLTVEVGIVQRRGEFVERRRAGRSRPCMLRAAGSRDGGAAMRAGSRLSIAAVIGSPWRRATPASWSSIERTHVRTRRRSLGPRCGQYRSQASRTSMPWTQALRKRKSVGARFIGISCQ